MNRQPRRGAPRAVCLAGVLLLAGCGSAAPQSASEGTPDSTADSATENMASGATGTGCAAPPPPRADAPTYDTVPSPTAATATLTASVTTTCGPLQIELYAARAPVTVASFAFLAEEGYWVDSPCHRLTTEGIFVLQCGDPTGTGRGGPGYTFGVENAPSDGVYPAGTVAMARTTDPNSNGAQFFIVYDDTRLPVEGGGYSIFGRVTTGMDVVDRVAAQGVEGGVPDGLPAQPISILSVEVTEEEATTP